MDSKEREQGNALQEQLATHEESLAALPQAILSRTARVQSPLIITLDQPPSEPTRAFAPGTIVLLVGKPDSPLLNRLGDAARQRDYGLMDLILERIAGDLTGAAMASLEDRGEVVPDISEVPSVAEIRYATKLLARGMFPVPGADVTAGSILWTGGELVDEQFSCVEYITDAEAPRLDSLILKVPPSLSDVEQAVIRQVPQDQSELHLRSLEVNLWPAAAARLAWAAATWVWRRRAATTVTTATVTLNCEGHVAALPSDTQLESLGDRLADPSLGHLQAAVSVDQLLDIRQEIISQRSSR